MQTVLYPPTIHSSTSHPEKIAQFGRLVCAIHSRLHFNPERRGCSLTMWAREAGKKSTTALPDQTTVGQRPKVQLQIQGFALRYSHMGMASDRQLDARLPEEHSTTRKRSSFPPVSLVSIFLPICAVAGSVSSILRIT